MALKQFLQKQHLLPKRKRWKGGERERVGEKRREREKGEREREGDDNLIPYIISTVSKCDSD